LFELLATLRLLGFGLSNSQTAPISPKVHCSEFRAFGFERSKSSQEAQTYRSFVELLAFSFLGAFCHIRISDLYNLTC
jgi:hypothetical protein